jgi:hypothetical protein
MTQAVLLLLLLPPCAGMNSDTCAYLGQCSSLQWLPACLPACNSLCVIQGLRPMMMLAVLLRLPAALIQPVILLRITSHAAQHHSCLSAYPGLEADDDAGSAANQP